jgi:hypothetical protein
MPEQAAFSVKRWQAVARSNRLVAGRMARPERPMARAALAIGRWVARAVLCYLVALPFSPSIWVTYQSGGRCLVSPAPADGAIPCLAEGVILGPFFLLAGPIAHEEEDPPSPWPAVLSTAAFLAIVLLAVWAWWARRKPAGSSDGSASRAVVDSKQRQ